MIMSLLTKRQQEVRAGPDQCRRMLLLGSRISGICCENAAGKDKTMKVLDTYNAAAGAVIAVLSYIFGEHWMLFALFLAFNVADWLTGWAKSRMAQKENSAAGWKGVLKKLGYWLMIAVAFGASAVFVEIGTTLGINLEITVLLGWFVLASLIVNELRSILENFVEMGYDVPRILTKGLEVADKAINQPGQDDKE